MVIIIIVLVLTIIVLTLGFVAYFGIKRKIQNYTNTLFGTNTLKEAMQQAKLNEENTPKSVTGMEPLQLPYLIKDFPNIEINEFKKMAESSILKTLKNIEDKNNEKIPNSSEKVSNYIQSKIDDNTKMISYDSIKIHKTVLNRYQKETGMCKVEFHTSLEYYLKKNNETKKIQSRFKTEYIYIINESKLNNNLSGIALNCPNCGAPIQNLGQKKCSYCGTGVIDLVKRTWILNDIQEF